MAIPYVYIKTIEIKYERKKKMRIGKIIFTSRSKSGSTVIIRYPIQVHIKEILNYPICFNCYPNPSIFDYLFLSYLSSL